MKTLGTIFVIAGIIIFIKPDIVAYFLGAILLIIGANILGASAYFGGKNRDSYKFGDYEILKRKK